MTIQQRVQSPTPKFFKALRNFSLMLGALSASLLAAPAVLPAVVIKIAGYIAVAGSVAGTVSQLTTSEAAGEKVNTDAS